MSFRQELTYAFRSLMRMKGLTITVVLTLALGIGANAAIFSLVRAVLLRPLVNHDEQRLVYIRQAAPGLGAENILFSMPEIRDLRKRVDALAAVGDFSTVSFSMTGLGEPRQVRAGVVSGNYFEVMGLRPVLGRLLGSADDGAAAPGAAVLTHRFWSTAFHSDPSVLGRTIRLDDGFAPETGRAAVVVGVLEPSIPYPAETELFANVVTSPHHVSAIMIEGREHRMTEVFARLSPSSTLEAAEAQLAQAYAGIKADHGEAYPDRAGFTVRMVPLREQLTSNARTVLMVLLAASILIFVIAISNVANLILARTVRRESELALRAALGAHTGALRFTLLAESVLLCGTGALMGAALAWPLVGLLSTYASRFSLRALEMTVDANLVLVSVLLALIAAVVLGYAPALPSDQRIGGLKLSGGSIRIAGGTRRRLNAFAVTQVGASFVLLAGAVMLLRTFLALQAASPGFDAARVLAVDVPVTMYGRTEAQIREFYRQVQTRVGGLPGVEQVAIGSAVPWRDMGPLERLTFSFRIEGERRDAAGDDPRAKFRSVSPGYFAALGLPLTAGRDFTADDDHDSERVVIISESVAATLFPGRTPLNRRLLWTDGVMKFIGVSPEPRRIVGVVPDIDDEHVAPGPAFNVYHPFEQQVIGGRLFVHTRADPQALVPEITGIVRRLSEDQPIEHAATLADVRAEVLAPERLNTVVFGVFAAVALAIAVIGVAGVLAFSVSARTREFAIQMAIGSHESRILAGVLRSGATMAAAGIAAGVGGGYVIARLAVRYVDQMQMPGGVAIIGAAAILLLAAVAAALVPAVRAARVNVMEALRAE
ncbi:MAG: ADOP family duplicated permease [Vicinamibacterales bacterium]